MYKAKNFPSKSARYVMRALKEHAKNGIVRGMSVEKIAKAADVNPTHCRVLLRDIERNGKIKTVYQIATTSEYHLLF